MASPTHICIECVVSQDIDEPVALNKDGYCPRCGSSSVVPVETFVELDRLKKKSEAPPSHTDDQWKARYQVLKDARYASTKPIRTWLASRTGQVFLHSDDSTTLDAAKELQSVLTQWDGWAFHVFNPWDEDSPAVGQHCIELVQGVKNGPRWLVVLSSEVNEVRPFHDGTV